MKRSERHRLKENEVALSVARLREQFEEHRRQITTTAVIVVVIVATVGGYLLWRRHADVQSRAMLVDAMAIEGAQVVPPPAPPAPGQPANAANTQPPPPGSFPSEEAKLKAALPKFIATADQYPSTKAGIAARYQAASCLVALGRPKEAIEQYRQVIDRAGTGLYGDMGRLGLAEAQIQAHDYDAAISQYRELSTRSDLPTDAILMQLGRAYAAAGRKSQAQQTFQRILDEYPQSQYAQVAKRELDAVKTAGA
jgi:TolA-binding protein